MFILDVEARVAEIADTAKTDAEAAATMERELLRDVLNAIAAGDHKAPRLAETVLKVFDLKFDRW